MVSYHLLLGFLKLLSFSKNAKTLIELFKKFQLVSRARKNEETVIFGVTSVNENSN